MRDDIFGLWVYLSATPLLGLTLTLVAYQIGLYCAKAFHFHPLVNPVLIAMILLAAVLTVTNTPYRTYFEGAQFVHFLLGTATVALAVPFYERLPQLRAMWKPLCVGLVAGACAAVGVAVAIMMAFSAKPELILTMVPKSVTAPIAMGVAERIGGVPTVAAVFCVLTGIVGAASGKIIFDALNIRSMAVRGFALGTCAHGIGTARAYLVSPEAGAFAGLALGLHGLLASIVIPLIYAAFSK
jgi:predicted murein hydrolase (TIGR00659 family)